MFVVIVDFQLHAANVAQFMAAIRVNAQASVEDEPGCSQFDVCVDPADATKVFLYEIYDDRAAFDAHLATSHFAVFVKAVAPWVMGKSARMLTRAHP